MVGGYFFTRNLAGDGFFFPCKNDVTPNKKQKLGCGFRYFFMFTPKIGEDEPILTSIFFRWVGSTTNQKKMDQKLWLHWIEATILFLGVSVTSTKVAMHAYILLMPAPFDVYSWNLCFCLSGTLGRFH